MIDFTLIVFKALAQSVCCVLAAAIAIVCICFLIWGLSYLITWGVHSGWNAVADITDDDDDDDDDDGHEADGGAK